MKNFINILVLIFSFLSFNNLVAQEIKNETSKTEKLRESQNELKGSELNKTSTILSIEDGIKKLNELDNRLLEYYESKKYID